MPPSPSLPSILSPAASGLGGWVRLGNGVIIMLVVGLLTIGYKAKGQAVPPVPQTPITAPQNQTQTQTPATPPSRAGLLGDEPAPVADSADIADTPAPAGTPAPATSTPNRPSQTGPGTPRPSSAGPYAPRAMERGRSMAIDENAPLAEDPDDGADYDREFTYGVNFNTRGGLIGGAAVKYAWQQPNGRYHRLMFEVVNIKHPKEARRAGPSSSFLAYKTNYLFSARPSYGQEYTLFRKGPEEGVHLNLIAAAGPSFGLVKPYYVLYGPNPMEPAQAESRPFDPSLRLENILGVGRFTDGLNQMRVVPGMHVRAGLSFEFGRGTNVMGIEAGFLSEFFSERVTIMRSQPLPTGRDFERYSGYHSLYLIWYYGNKL